MTAALLVGVIAAADAAAPTNGGELRRALPAPGKPSLPSTREYAGVERGANRAVAVVVHRNGSAVAFVCDGRTFWRWLTGRVRRGRVTLRGAAGTRLTAALTRTRLKGALRLAGKARRISLSRSVRGTGLRRLVDGAFEGAWIVTNRGRIRGVGTISKTTVISSSTDATAPAEDEGTTATGDGDVEARLFLKARCAVILLKTQPLRVEQNNGTLSPEEEAELTALFDKFTALGCREALAGTAR